LRTLPAFGPLLMSFPGVGASHWKADGWPQAQRGRGVRLQMKPRAPPGSRNGVQGIRPPRRRDAHAAR
jgi:hypothetical protein